MAAVYLTQAEIDKIKELWLKMPNSAGNYSDLYRLIGDILSQHDGAQNVTNWFRGAEQANVGSGALRTGLTKLGNTMFEADGIALERSQPWFVSAAAINELRRDAVAAHEAARLAAWERPERKAPAEPPAVYPTTQLSYLANVYNEKARAFYHKHGVGLIDAAYEAHQEAAGSCARRGRPPCGKAR